jgi:hypothetical protein
MATKGNVYGEGNYEATRQYNEATKKFIEAGKVDKAARDAAPRSPEEAQQMKQAEQAALLRAKETPPAVKEPPEEKDPAIDDPLRETVKGNQR